MIGLPPWQGWRAELAGGIPFIASAVVGGAFGWALHRPPAIETKSEAKHETARTSSTNGEVVAFRMTGEVAPRATVKWKRTPVAMPGAGCPVAYAEEGESTTSADSRIAQEATKIAVATVAQGRISDAQMFSSRTDAAQPDRRFTLGLLGVTNLGAAEGGDRRWSAALIVGARLVGPLGIAGMAEYAPGGNARIGAGVTWSW